MGSDDIIGPPAEELLGGRAEIGDPVRGIEHHRTLASSVESRRERNYFRSYVVCAVRHVNSSRAIYRKRREPAGRPATRLWAVSSEHDRPPWRVGLRPR